MGRGLLADHLLITLPYPYGPALEHVRTEARHVRLLWAVPITPAEAAHVRERGVDPLEGVFERDGTDVLDPARPSVV